MLFLLSPVRCNLEDHQMTAIPVIIMLGPFRGENGCEKTYIHENICKGMLQTISFLLQLIKFIIHPGCLVWLEDLSRNSFFGCQLEE